jgi:hypothetical protein
MCRQSDTAVRAVSILARISWRTAWLVGKKRVDQFELRVGDIVNPVKRSAGILTPEEVDPALDHALTGRRALRLS